MWKCSLSALQVNYRDDEIASSHLRVVVLVNKSRTWVHAHHGDVCLWGCVRLCTVDYSWLQLTIMGMCEMGDYIQGHVRLCIIWYNGIMGWLFYRNSHILLESCRTCNCEYLAQMLVCSLCDTMVSIYHGVDVQNAIWHASIAGSKPYPCISRVFKPHLTPHTCIQNPSHSTQAIPLVGSFLERLSNASQELTHITFDCTVFSTAPMLRRHVLLASAYLPLNCSQV